MTFDDDLIDEVKAQAPPGVHFDDPEVHSALQRALNLPLINMAFLGRTAVETAAIRALRDRIDRKREATS